VPGHVAGDDVADEIRWCGGRGNIFVFQTHKVIGRLTNQRTDVQKCRAKKAKAAREIEVELFVLLHLCVFSLNCVHAIGKIQAEVAGGAR
jgi:hypothetical protein